MVELNILSGRKAGSIFRARLFPFSVGRLPSCDAVLDESGVWDRHFLIEWLPEGFFLRTDPKAFVTLGGDAVQKRRLHNGDVIEIGLCKIRFGLAGIRQRSLKVREILTWTALALISLGQVALIYALSH